jgi:hypothetical protein
MPEAPVVDLAALRQLTESGYGFYQNPARARADDLLVRSQAADALHHLGATITAAVQSAHAALPPPSRAQPFPDAASMASIRALRALHDRIEALETRLRGPAALPDRDFSRVVPTELVRQELVALDAALLAATTTLRADPDTVAAAEAAVTAREAFAARGKR